MTESMKKASDEYRRKQKEEREKASDERRRKLREQELKEEEARKAAEIAFKKQDLIRKQETSINSENVNSIDENISIESHFDGYNDVRITKIWGTYWLAPLYSATLQDDIKQLSNFIGDSEIAKCMPYLYGNQNNSFSEMYLRNTYMCTEHGIAFGYAIRESRTLNPMDLNFGPMQGFIKVTTPSHNRVTNNFDGWLIDYAMLPQYRGRGIMKLAIQRIIENLEDLEIDELYAMVDIDNTASLQVLGSNGFSISDKPGGINPNTRKPFTILVYKF